MLDLGSGGGIDVLLSARRVGPTGKAYGLDMTDEMLALARENQRKAGARPTSSSCKGEIEAIPLPAETVDVVISNCVINLSGDKPQVLAEAARVLQARRPLRRLRRDRRRGHGRRNPRRHAAVDRLHRGRADRGASSKTHSPPPASPTSRSTRRTASTSTPARRSSAPASRSSGRPADATSPTPDSNRGKRRSHSRSPVRGGRLTKKDGRRGATPSSHVRMPRLWLDAHFPWWSSQSRRIAVVGDGRERGVAGEDRQPASRRLHHRCPGDGRGAGVEDGGQAARDARPQADRSPLQADRSRHLDGAPPTCLLNGISF